MQNLMVMKKTKVFQEGSMYSHANFHTSACMHARTLARNMKGPCVLWPISQSTYIRLEKLKKQTPPNMARVKQIKNAIANGPKATPPQRDKNEGRVVPWYSSNAKFEYCLMFVWHQNVYWVSYVSLSYSLSNPMLPPSYHDLP